MENGNEKQLIFLKDLVFRALYQWKKILVVAIVFAVLLGTFSALKSGGVILLEGLDMTPETEEKIEQLKARCKRYEELIEKQKAYIESSPYMDIDPYATYTCGFHLYPEPTYDVPITEFTPMEQDTEVLLRAYRSLITGSETFQKLAEQFDLDVRDLRDLVAFDGSEKGFLGIRVYGRDIEETQKLSNALLDVVLASEETIDQDVHNHNLKVIHFQKGPAYDMSTANSQNTAYQKLLNYQSAYISLKDQLERYEPTELTVESGDVLLYSIVGIFLGTCLVVGVAWVIHLGSDKVYSSRVLVNRTGVRVLGCTYSGKKRNAVDRWLRKMEGRCSGNEEAALAANIRNRCQDVKNLVIMGTFDRDVLSALGAALEQANISCKVCADKTEALEALSGCDGVVLAETCGVSSYSQVEWAMETVSDYQKNLIGCVLIDG